MLMLKSIGLGVVKFRPVNQNVDWQMDGRTDESKDRPTHQSHQWSGWMHPIKLSITRCLSGDPLCHRCFLVDTFPWPSQTIREIQFDRYMIFFMFCHAEASKFFWKGVPKISQPPPLLKGMMLWLTLGTFFENMEVKVLCIIYTYCGGHRLWITPRGRLVFKRPQTPFATLNSGRIFVPKVGLPCRWG